jgi:molybdopterin/thiamine biosynthesis adenylyltransferase
MPEISGPGQKTLLESRAVIFARSARPAAPMLYYLVSSGIGHIKCYFDDSAGMESLKENLRDLNPDVWIEMNEFAETKAKSQNASEKISCLIVFGDINFIQNMRNNMNEPFDIDTVSGLQSHHVPTVFAAAEDWWGVIQTVKNPENAFLFSDTVFGNTIISTSPKDDQPVGYWLSCCLAGALAAIESIKLCLNLGNSSENPLYFDLLAMNFEKLKYNIAPPPLPSKQNTDDIIKKLLDSKVLIVGTGGLGSPASYALALAGVGTLGLVDSDCVEISNLNRQILHSTSRIGTPKVKSAEIFIKDLNPIVNVVTYEARFTKTNAMQIIKDYDVIIDGVDNLPTRYLLNDSCFFAEKPLVEAGVLRFDGLGMTVVPKEGHCYRCIFPEMPPAGSVLSCSESGILGPVPGVMGFIEAAEALKLLAGIGNTLQNRLMIFDAMDLDFRITDVRRDENCPLCGENPYIKELAEYETTCDDVSDSF